MTETVSSDSNFDDLTGLVDEEDISINDGIVLTVNAPNLNGPLDKYPREIDTNVSGTLRIDGTNIRQVFFDGGSGTVPSVGDTLTDDTTSASGEIVSVVEATGSGHYLLRTITGGSVADNDSLSSGSWTGSAVGADQVGYLHFLGTGPSGWSTAHFAGGGDFICDGLWYELGTGDGTADQTFTAFCTNPLAYLEVETGSGTGVYERFYNCGTQQNLDRAGSGAVLGPFFFQLWDTTTIQFGDATNGKSPANGAIVRCPNIMVSQSDPSDRTTISGPDLSTYTSDTRVGGDAMYMDLDRVTFGYGTRLEPSQPRVKFRDIGCTGEFSISGTQLEPCDIDGLVVGRWIENIANKGPTDLYELIKGGTFNNFVYVGDDYSFFPRLQNWVGMSVDGFSLYGFYSLTAQYSSTMNNMVNCSFTNVNLVGCSWDSPGILVDFTLSVVRIAARISGAGSTYTDGIGFAGGGSNLDIDDVQYLAEITNAKQFSTAVIRIFGGVKDAVRITNIGTRAAPLKLDNACWYLVYSSANQSLRCQNLWMENNSLAEGPLYTAAGDNGLILYNSGDVHASSAGTLNFRYTQGPHDLRGLRGKRPSVTGYNATICDYFISDTEGELGMFSPSIEPGDATQQVLTGNAVLEGSTTTLKDEDDTVTWLFDYFILGHTAFRNLAPVFWGGGSLTYVTEEYQIDTGSGWSAWKTLDATTLSGETISASSGFRFKVRITRNSTSPGTNWSVIRLFVLTSSSAAAQTDPSALYTLPGSTVTIANMVEGSRYELYNVTTDVVEALGTAGATDVVLASTAVNGDTLRLRVRKSSAAVKYLDLELFGVVASSAALLFISQVEDTVAA